MFIHPIQVALVRPLFDPPGDPWSWCWWKCYHWSPCICILQVVGNRSGIGIHWCLRFNRVAGAGFWWRMHVVMRRWPQVTFWNVFHQCGCVRIQMSGLIQFRSLRYICPLASSTLCEWGSSSSSCMRPGFHFFVWGSWCHIGCVIWRSISDPGPVLMYFCSFFAISSRCHEILLFINCYGIIKRIAHFRLPMIIYTGEGILSDSGVICCSCSK